MGPGISILSKHSCLGRWVSSTEVSRCFQWGYFQRPSGAVHSGAPPTRVLLNCPRCRASVWTISEKPPCPGQALPSRNRQQWDLQRPLLQTSLLVAPHSSSPWLTPEEIVCVSVFFRSTTGTCRNYLLPSQFLISTLMDFWELEASMSREFILDFGRFLSTARETVIRPIHSSFHC